MECKYENNLSVLGEGTTEELTSAWNTINLQCALLLGVSSPTANLEINIANTTSRINGIKAWLFVQCDCMQRFGYPLPELFHEFNKYGHTILYSGDDKDLLQQLETIEIKERQYKMLLTRDKARLKTLQVAEGTESTDADSRVHFIKTVNILSEAIGFHIDRDKMMAEEFFILFAEKTAAAKAARSN